MNKYKYVIISTRFDENGVEKEDYKLYRYAYSLKRAKEIAEDLINEDTKIKQGRTNGLFNKKYKNYTFVTAITSNSNVTEYIFYKEI